MYLAFTSKAYTYSVMYGKTGKPHITRTSRDQDKVSEVAEVRVTLLTAK